MVHRLFEGEGREPGKVDALAGAQGAISKARKAFLDLIAWAEGADYDVMFTGKKFAGFADHPRQIQRGGGWSSDAAGRYQFLSTTWDEAKKALSLPDFSPSSQDQAALWLIARRGALSAVDAGHLRTALEKCSWEWASLPPGRYGQPQKSFGDLQRKYDEFMEAA